MKRVLFTIFATLTLLLPLTSHAQSAKEINWDALVPETLPHYNPMTELTPSQAADFDTASIYRKMPTNKDTYGINTVTEEEAKAAEKRLANQGIDVLKLLRKWDAWEAAVEAAGKKLVSSLNDTKVRLAGYLLPLEFSDDGTNEFLLVPYVGACIHVPPPPPNQIVFVTTDKPVKLDDAFTPVWITGTLKTEWTNKSVTLVDGSSPVSAGYAMAHANIKPYNG